MKSQIPSAARISHTPLTEYQVQIQGRLVSLSQPAPEIDPAQFMRHSRGRERIYWHDGQTGSTLAGVGVAADLMAWGESRFSGIQRQASDLFAQSALLNQTAESARPRLFGGFAFRDDFTPDNAWFGFNPAHFVLPHYQLFHQRDETWLTINTLQPIDEDPQANQAQLRTALDMFRSQLNMPSTPGPISGNPGPPVVELRYPMPFAEWQHIIEEAIDQFRDTPLEKVVLSRVCELLSPDLIDVDRALAYLRDHYPHCFCFLFEPRPYHAFFGATPELLARVNGRQLDTMSLAGSIQRGQSAEEDLALGETLLNSQKDRHEHALVVAALRKRLETITTSLEVAAQPAIYRLSNIQHLHTALSGTLKEKMGILPLVELLHPTPALGGSPRQMALAFIRNAEPVPRGWYAAPVGWIDHNLDGAFAVAIRSAVAQKKRVWLYAGAGIVADSRPDKEWEETGWKFRPIQDALGLPPQRANAPLETGPARHERAAH